MVQPSSQKVYVDNEVETLRRVVVRRPGAEIERMTQHELERLLFDDILSPTETGREHDIMVEILRGGGAEILEIGDLLTEAIRVADEDELRALVERVCEDQGVRELVPAILEREPSAMTSALIEGVYWSEVELARDSLPRVRALAFEHRKMALGPSPNLMFMRDPCVAVRDRVIRGRMATQARSREAHLVAFALRNELGKQALIFDEDDDERSAVYRSLEGGDVLVLSPEVLMIGCSERTTAQTIERLCTETLFSDTSPVQRVYTVLMPEARSVMHLDTILTQVDRSLFLGHAPLIEGQGDGSEPLRVVRLTRDAAPEEVEGASVLDVLREEFGSQVQLVACGGDQRLHQEREQWTDGANAVCVAPGRIILYARNRRTVNALSDQGFEEVRLSVVQSSEERRERIAAGMKRDRTVFSFSGSELSRARGGGRCLTMPLLRDPWVGPRG
jgi:arginine deiminase